MGEPADHFIDLFWARLLPYIAVVKPGERVTYRLLLRNNLEKKVTFAARLLPPPGWVTSEKFSELTLAAGAKGELKLDATRTVRVKPLPARPGPSTG